MKEIDNGNRPGTHFNRNGWKNLLDSFNTMTGRSYDRLQLKNHWDSMKRDWQNWDSLTRGESGLRWDPIRKTVDATDECWDEKIQRNPNLAKFRHRSLEMYKIYYDPIFRDITGAGFEAFASGQGFPPQDSGIGSESFELPDKFYDENGEEDENTGDNGDVHITPTLGGFSNEDSDYGIHFILPHPSYPLKRKSVNCTPQSNKREPLKVAPLNQHFGNKFHFHSRRSSATSSSIASQALGPPSIKDCVQMLSDLPLMEKGGDIWNFSCNLLLKKEVREVFAAQPSTATQLSWLKYNYDLSKQSKKFTFI